jgi:hypothetical protein
MKTYLFSYQYEGAQWVFEMKAESAEEAKRRVSRLQYAALDGELAVKLPATPLLSRVLTPIISMVLWLMPVRRDR